MTMIPAASAAFPLGLAFLAVALIVFVVLYRREVAARTAQRRAREAWQATGRPVDGWPLPWAWGGSASAGSVPAGAAVAAGTRPGAPAWAHHPGETPRSSEPPLIYPPVPREAPEVSPEAPERDDVPSAPAPEEHPEPSPAERVALPARAGGGS